MSKNVNERSHHEIDRGGHDEHCQSEKPKQPSGLPSRPLLLAKKIHAPVLTQTRISAKRFSQQPTSGGADRFSSVRWSLLTPGGLTDHYLSDYPNMYGDLSAGSRLNALTRDEDHAREFIQRHQDKLIYGSDCNDLVGTIPGCQGAQTIATVRRLSSSHAVERKLLYGNAKRVFTI